MGHLEQTAALAAAGLLLGGLFGAVVQASHFCTMGAVSDRVLFGSWRRLRVWALAAATALLLTQALVLAGAMPAPAAPPEIAWLGALAGGLLFGHGSVLAGGCAARALVRLGTGSLKALLVLLVMAVSALAVTTGPLAPLAGAAFAAGSVALPLPSQGLDGLLAAVGLTPAAARALATLALFAPLAAFCLADPRFRRAPADLAAGVALGAVVALGWLATASLGGPPASLAYVEPAGGLVLWLGTGAGRLPGFAAAAVAGTALGATLVAAGRGGLRLEAFASREDTVRHCAGGALMGVGGALALGCSVGNGLAGVSALSLHALLALGAILAGATAGVKALENGRSFVPWPRAAAALPPQGGGA